MKDHPVSLAFISDGNGDFFIGTSIFSAQILFQNMCKFINILYFFRKGKNCGNAFPCNGIVFLTAFSASPRCVP